MFRKNEDACAEWSLDNVRLCAERQDRILDCAAGMLRPGGRLVYSTCTFAPEEDEGSVCRFLRRHREFRILPVDKRKAGLEGCDGIPGSGGLPSYGCDGLSGGDGLEGSDGLSGSGGLEGSDGLSGSEGLPDYADVPVVGLEHAVRLWPQRIKGKGILRQFFRKKEKCRKGIALSP